MYVDILILSQLMHREKHGYEIKKDAERILGGVYRINNNSLYPILKQLEEMGAISKRVEEQEGKPNRHVYSITPTGAEILSEMILDYPDDLALNDYEFYTRVGLFDLLDQNARKRILAKRKAALSDQCAHLEAITAAQRAPEGHSHLFSQDVLKLIQGHREAEIKWIENLLTEGEQKI